MLLELPEDVRGRFYAYICEYGLFGKEPELRDGVERALWIPIRDSIDGAKERRSKNKENGALGGKKHGKTGQQECGEAKDGEPGSEKKTEARFVPPTAEDVRAYAAENQLNVDAEKFVAYYKANGWRVGKNPMKDWKAAVRSWSRNGYGRDDKTIYGGGAADGDVEKYGNIL